MNSFMSGFKLNSSRGPMATLEILLVVRDPPIQRHLQHATIHSRHSPKFMGFFNRSLGTILTTGPCIHNVSEIGRHLSPGLPQKWSSWRRLYRSVTTSIVSMSKPGAQMSTEWNKGSRGLDVGDTSYLERIALSVSLRTANRPAPGGTNVGGAPGTMIRWYSLVELELQL
ncbi:unnamed protein product [Ectocarpus sp. 12 AP-2014]